MNYFRPPSLSLRFFPVWQRNFLVWRKLAIPSILGNLADPMIYMLGLGYGIGTLLPEVGGVPYIAFLAAGAVCFSTMNSATFEALYSAFSRMQVQKTWEAILNAPVSLDDLVLGELAWAASKAALSGAAILGVAAALGLVASPLALWSLPLVFLAGLTFAALGLVMTALAPSYDFFMYYFTLFVTPMTLLPGAVGRAAAVARGEAGAAAVSRRSAGTGVAAHCRAGRLRRRRLLAGARPGPAAAAEVGRASARHAAAHPQWSA